MDDHTVRRLEQLITTGKKKGYISYDEIDDLLPQNYSDGREIDDILSTLEKAGVEILEEPPEQPQIRIFSINRGKLRVASRKD